MTDDPISAPVHDQYSSFRNHLLRIIMLDGVPFFALSDLAEALGYRQDAVERAVRRPDFPEHAKRSCTEDTDAGPVEATLLPPTGVYWLTALTDPARGQSLSAWARREGQRRCPNPTPGDPTMFLTLNPNGSLPPRPMRYSGRYAEWDESRLSDERLAALARGIR